MSRRILIYFFSVIFIAAAVMSCIMSSAGKDVSAADTAPGYTLYGGEAVKGAYPYNGQEYGAGGVWDLGYGVHAYAGQSYGFDKKININSGYSPWGSENGGAGAGSSAYNAEHSMVQLYLIPDSPQLPNTEFSEFGLYFKFTDANDPSVSITVQMYSNQGIVLFGISNVNGTGENNVNVRHDLIKMNGTAPQNFGFQFMPYVNENNELSIYVQSLSDEMYAAKPLSYGTLPVLKAGEDIGGEVTLSIYTEGAAPDFMIKSVGGEDAFLYCSEQKSERFDLTGASAKMGSYWYDGEKYSENAEWQLGEGALVTLGAGETLQSDKIININSGYSPWAPGAGAGSSQYNAEHSMVQVYLKPGSPQLPNTEFSEFSLYFKFTDVNDPSVNITVQMYSNKGIVLFGISNVNGKGENNVNIQHGLIKMSGAVPYNFGFQLMPYVNENRELGIYVQSLSDEMYAAQRLSYGTLPVLKVGEDIGGEVTLSIYTEGAGGDFMLKSVGGLPAADHYGPVPENMFDLSSELFGEYGLNEQTEFPSADYSDGVAAGNAELVLIDPDGEYRTGNSVLLDKTGDWRAVYYSEETGDTYLHDFSVKYRITDFDVGDIELIYGGGKDHLDYGETLSEITVSGGKAYYNSAEVAGEFRFINDSLVPDVSGESGYTKVYIAFVPEQSEEYCRAETSFEVLIKVEKATPSLKGEISVDSKKYYAGEALPQIAGEFYGVFGEKLAGTFVWEETVLISGENSYSWTFVPEDDYNYNAGTGAYTIVAENAPSPPDTGGEDTTPPPEDKGKGWIIAVIAVSVAAVCAVTAIVIVAVRKRRRAENDK